MISCKRATELLSQEQDAPLSTSEKIQLKIHLFICACCEQFRKQLQVLRTAMGSLEKDNPEQPLLSQTARDRIIQAAETALKENDSSKN